MKALEGLTRTAIFGFCASHIIFTLILDGQSIGKSYYPRFLQDLSTWYGETFNDPLMSAAPGELLWFQSFICCEMVVQLPFFLIACHYFGNATLTAYPDWFRSYCIVYGAHTATTLIPILTTLATAEQLSQHQMLILLGFYLPYLFFPLWILYLAVTSSQSGAKAKKI